MELKVKMKNIGLVRELNQEFKSSNVYLLSGKNGVGKTTAANAIKALFTGEISKGKLTNGEDTGFVEGLISAPDGMSYKVKINLREGKNPSFTIIDSDLNTSKRKGDLASIFSYQDINADNFLALGLSEPGRRKQTEYFMQLMPQDVQDRIKEIDEQTNSSTGILYKNRRNINVELDVLKKRMPDNYTSEDTDLASKAKEWKTEVAVMNTTLELKVDRYNKELNAKKDLIREKEVAQRLIAEKENRIADIKSELFKLENELVIEKDSLLALDKTHESTITREEVLSYQKQVKASETALEQAEKSVRKIEVYVNAEEELKVYTEKAESLTTQINEARKEKKELLSENISGDLTIENGELKYVDESGMFSVNENDLSYSTGIMIVSKLLIALNPNYKLLTIGKAAELDESSIAELIKFAKQQDAIIMLDHVDAGPLKINVYES